MTDLPEFNPAEHGQGEVVQHEPPSGERSLARRIALQVLYEVDAAGHDVGSVMGIHLQARQVNPTASHHVRLLVRGVVRHREKLDATIHHFAPEWPIEQVAIIDRNILRIAMFEFAVYGDTPTGVAIDEAVLLAKMFGAESTPGFINGVLGALSKDDAILDDLGAFGAAMAEADDAYTDEGDGE